MRLPPGFSARPAHAEDPAAVASLANAAEEVDLGEALMEVSDVEADWQHLDLARDVVIIDDADGIAGWAQVNDGRADAHVHPRARARGLGLAIVEWTEARALETAPPDGPVTLGQTVPEGMVGTEELFSRRGYEQLWESWVLRFPPDAAPPDRPAPEGVQIRGYEPGDERDVHRVIDTAFSEWEGREAGPFEDWRRRVTRRSDFDPTLLLVATDAQALIGAVVGIHYPDEGWVDQIAVDGAHRDRGIATALLSKLFADFRARGETRLGLNTHSPTGALGLYLNLGMEIDHTFVRWSRRLR